MGQLWQRRLRQHLNDQARYLRLVFNDQFTIVLFVILGGALYGYAQFVRGVDGATAKWLPWLVLVILALCVLVGRLATFVVDADAVFLLPRAASMQDYLTASMRYSLILPLLLMAVLCVAAWPVLAVTWHVGSAAIICLVVTGLLVKYGDMMLQVNAVLMDQPAQTPHRVSLVGLMAISVYATQLPVYWVPVIVAAAMDIMLRVWLEQRLQHGQVDFARAAHQEDARMQGIYRVYSMFTDVPGLRGSIKRRRWLDGLLKHGARRQSRTWDFLYWRSFIRRPEYGNLFIRLTVIAVVLLCLTTSWWVALLISLATLYLTGIQLVPLFTQYQEIVFTHLYPLPAKTRVDALRRLLVVLLLIQAIILGVTAGIIGGLVGALAVLAGGIVFIALFATVYLARVTRKQMQLL